MATILKKVCMLGFYAVGKTSMVRQFISTIFDDKYLTTLGVKVDKKEVAVEGQSVTLMLWDIAGAEEHFSVPMSYVKGSAGYLLVVDTTRPTSVDRALEIAAQIEAAYGKLPVVIALNKVDLADQWALDDSHMEKLKSLNGPIIRSSAKTGEGVEEAFLEMAKMLVSKG